MIFALVPGGETVLCTWVGHLTLKVPLSIEEYKWVPANCWGNLTNCGRVTSDPRGVEILLTVNQDKLQQL